jgi:hypothetical protein
LKLLDENIGRTLEDIGIGNAFLNRTPTAQKITRIAKWDCIKLKSICTAKETTKIKSKFTNRRESLSLIHWIKD